jgi:hypothetical protein
MQTLISHRRRCIRVPAKFQPALVLLLEAAQFAAQTRSNRFEFAVELDELQSAGMTKNDVRLLVRTGLVDHAREATLPEHSGRRFLITSNSCFSAESCFVLTSAGLAAAICVNSRLKHSHAITAERRLLSGQEASKVRPVWDAHRHVLTFNGQLVKQFKSPATNQELILSAFQEEGWPPRVDDPLSPTELDAKRRLSDAIRCLNRSQLRPLLRFRGDGSGQGILWDVMPQCRVA